MTRPQVHRASAPHVDDEGATAALWNVAMSVPRGNSRRTKTLLLAFVISPLAVLTVLCILIARSLEHGREMNEPPIGAGAGKTGMSNEFMGIGKEHPAPK